MIAGSLAFSGPDPLFGLGRIAEAQSSEELLKEYAAKDTDTDGLPDWQEALYGTDPTEAESFRAGILDGEAVAQGLVQPKVAVRAPGEPADIDSIPGTVAAPDSLTDRFSQTLLSQYLLGRGETPPSSEEIASFVETGVENLRDESASPDRFSPKDIRTSSETGSAALIRYAAEVESAFQSNSVSEGKSELTYFSEAMKGDAAALAEIKQLSDAYADIANALMGISVPAEAAQAHLAIANALAHLGETSADMAAMETDPVRALMGISLYGGYAEDLIAGFLNLHGVFAARQISIPEGAPGFNTMQSAINATKQ